MEQTCISYEVLELFVQNTDQSHLKELCPIFFQICLKTSEVFSPALFPYSWTVVNQKTNSNTPFYLFLPA